jgi:hypothetical protein
MLKALTDHLDGHPPARAVLDPQPGRCCVILTRQDCPADSADTAGPATGSLRG